MSTSQKKRTDFKSLFGDDDDTEILIESYACALQREILAQGRLYLTNKRLCFYANIVGWISNISIPLEDIVSIEKKSAALVIPNSILISTLHNRYFFASFVYRELAYEKLCICWKNILADSPREGNTILKEINESVNRGSDKSDINLETIEDYQTTLFANDDEQSLAENRGKALKAQASTKQKQSCDCTSHLEETILFEEISGDYAQVSSNLKSWTVFQSVNSEKNEDVIFFDAFFPEFDSAYRVRGLRVILCDNETVCSVEYGLTIMGMSGGDSKLRLRFCLYKTVNKNQLLVTCEVEPPKESWFKKQITAGLVGWATLCAKAAYTSSPTFINDRKTLYGHWINIRKRYESINYETKERVTKLILLICSLLVLYTSFRAGIGAATYNKEQVMPIDIKRIHTEYKEFLSCRSRQDDKRSLEEALTRLNDVLGKED